MGVSEMLVGVSISGLLFALFSGQPILILGATGPMLVFEEALYQICDTMELPFMPFRAWCGFWVTIIAVVLVALEGSFLVRYFTRFIQEIFALLISLIFVIETFIKLSKIFQTHPLLPYYPEPPDPNTALLSLILCFGTFLIAYFLKQFRNSKFLGRSVRRALGDFGVPIAIVIMVAVDYLIQDTYTEKLDVPDGLSPTASYKRGWLINPIGDGDDKLAVWMYFAAAVPALLVFILIFMESEITSMIVNKKDRKLKKGSGYHLDLLLIGAFATMCGILGLPFVCAATVRSVTHVSALTTYTTNNAPGEKAQLQEVKEQRMTGIAVHIVIGVSVLMGPVLRQVPLAVLFGVFLYMGVASMSGIQLLDRFKMIFMPVKHHPYIPYVRQVKTYRMHIYTFVQLLAIGVLWAVKSTQAALAFPFILIILVPVRLGLLKYIFTEKELSVLDREEEGGEMEDEEEELDFYAQAHMPM
ncbi:hypothetical protein CAPTEDRAFT_221709 [Capitella teleta]|uniref:Bicarbonate transporter-like transmembrane domain-containing protein n=1 Tax=Capitella teleta TaxID=283909 RepID=R7T7Z9_CAPTE|nr:hypothetical protein CAPTEDRAFT_221709 [Capitella teleta]|eukprot:ELT89578.1 hypothetical protein CAPTEDRAFT_221709 [Capitella teleta]